MLFKPLTVAALAGSACATWVIEQPFSFSAKDDKQLDSMTKAYSSQVQKYYATLTEGGDWTKAWDVVRAYQQTGKDVPAVVTATNAVTTYTTTPAWYNAMPTEAKTIFDGMDKKTSEIKKSIQDDANKSDAVRPLGMGGALGGALVAAVAGVLAGL